MAASLLNARGYFDLLDVDQEKLVIAGWLLHPEMAMDSFKAIVDGKVVHEAPLAESEGMGEVFPFVRHARRSVFHVSVAYEKKPGVRDIVIVGCAEGREVAKLETYFCEELRPKFAFPDVLKVRVANNANKAYFSASSFTSFRNYFEQVKRVVDPASIKNMLDWGCGCGRLTVMFAKGTSIPGIYGCDIDGESIAWCRVNLPGNFAVIPLLPPTQYKDSFFDLIISNSVFTHLTKNVQRKWLEEMRRIVAPGGLFIASVHGEFATFFNFRGKVAEPLKNEINTDFRGSYKRHSH